MDLRSLCKLYLNLCNLCLFPPTILSLSASLRAWPTIRHPPLARWRGALSPWVPYQRMETGRSVDSVKKKKEKSAHIEKLAAKYVNCPHFEPHPSGRKTTSAVPWMRSWSSANATVLWCTSATPTRTIGRSARSWGSGGTLWAPTRSSSTTTWPSRWASVSAAC